MNYKLAMSLINELQIFMGITEHASAKWDDIEEFSDLHPHWRPLINRYVDMAPDDAIADLKAYLIKQTETPESLIDVGLTPTIKARAIASIEKLQQFHKHRRSHEQSETASNTDNEGRSRRRKKLH